MAAGLLALGLLLGRSLAVRIAGKVHPWPCKNGNLMRTGQGHFSGSGPHDLTSATWVFDHDASDHDPSNAFYQSPVIDSDRNTYFSSTNGKYYSVAPGGEVNWEVQLRQEKRKAGQMPTPVLRDDALYTVDGQGCAVALSLASGKELWRAKYAHRTGDDSWSMGLDTKTGTLYAVGFPTEQDGKKCQYGGTHLYALDSRDGSTKWSYKLKGCTCNVMPSVVDNTLLFSDVTGIVYALDAATGAERWIAPGNDPNTFTTGTAAVGEDGQIFVASNVRRGRGVMRAYDLRSGAKHWERAFDHEANNAPAVYRDRRGRLLVAMGVSDNAEFPLPWLEGKVSYEGTVYALDAATGDTAWTFQPPVWKHPACAGSTFQRMCLPDAFTNPSVDASGTIYIGWMGGVAYGINGTTGKKVSSWQTGSGMQGAPGIADGMLVVSSCQRMAGFVRQP